MRKKLLFIFIAIILFPLILTACSTDTEGYKESLIMGFESQLEVDSITPFTDSGGKAQLNKDKKFISQGNSSMFVQLYGADKQSLPTFINNNRFVFYVHADESITRSKNFSNVMSLAVDIYNDSDYDISV